MDEEKRWFGKTGVGTLLAAQKSDPRGVSSVTRTMAAAYRQFDDIEFLLRVIEGEVTEGDADRLAKIKARHEKYRTEQ